MRQRDSWLSLAMAEELTSTERGLLALAGKLMERLAEAEVTAFRSPHHGRVAPREQVAGTDRAVALAGT
jgi:hypothetical protein